MLPLKEVLYINKCSLMHTILSKSAPEYLHSTFTLNPRHADKFLIPTPRINLFKSSFHYSGSVLWNSLPPHLRSKTNQNTFRNYLFEHFRRKGTWILHIQSCIHNFKWTCTVHVMYTYANDISSKENNYVPTLSACSCINIHFDTSRTKIVC